MGTGEKAKDFKGSFKRLAGRLRPDALKLSIIGLLALLSVALTVAAPKVLARATNLIFEGFISGNLPAGTTKEQVVAGLRAQGQDQLASMLSSMNLTPGKGVDMGAVGRVLAHRRSAVSARLPVRLAAELHHGRGRSAGRLPSAAGRRPEAQPPPPPLLRQPRPRGHPEPRDERHRQHPADVAADAHADRHRHPHSWWESWP